MCDVLHKPRLVPLLDGGGNAVRNKLHIAFILRFLLIEVLVEQLSERSNSAGYVNIMCCFL